MSTLPAEQMLKNPLKADLAVPIALYCVPDTYKLYKKSITTLIVGLIGSLCLESENLNHFVR